MSSRRLAILATVAALAIGSLLVAAPVSALTVTAYSPAALAAAKQTGRPFLIDFFASWCTTCRAQERVLESLIEENPAYATIEIIRVDWDEHERGELVRQMGIPRRSTLVVMRGEQELGRLVAATGKQEIARLLDLAL